MHPRYYIIYILCLIGIYSTTTLCGQTIPCNISLQGIVQDTLGEGLEGAVIYVEEQKTSSVADAQGNFMLDNLCAKSYHIHVSHIGCEEKIYNINLSKDTVLVISLEHDNDILDEVIIHTHESANHSNPFKLYTKTEQIVDKSIADVLEMLPGVNTFKSGVGIAKPQLEGLRNDRIDILNNGVIQAGQLWGSDHALEIDPLAATDIKLLRGVKAIPYSASLGGSTILIEQNSILEDKHLHLVTDYIFNTNNLSHKLNTQVSNFNSIVPFRIGATWQMAGDAKAPLYYLTNTGKRELNADILLEKAVGNDIKLSAYYSFFSTEIGILLGSQISNLTDLRSAISRDIPFFTQPNFTYDIKAPKQAVQHHLLKLRTKWKVTKRHTLDIFYALQINDRNEFDIRRGGRTTNPSLSVQQLNQFFNLSYEYKKANNFYYQLGLQLNYTRNINNPLTGIIPIVPNYYLLKPSLFATMFKTINAFKLAIGAKLAYQDILAYPIITFPRNTVLEKAHQFVDYTISTDVTYDKEALHFFGGVTYGVRNPTIHELYSQGLHQGVSGLEEGNPLLSEESSIKISSNLRWEVNTNLVFFANVFYQYVNDFMYLQVQPDFRLTIRGAFPLYKFEQSNVSIYGADINVAFQPLSKLKIKAEYNTVRGDNHSENIFLTGMPSDRLTLGMNYNFFPAQYNKKLQAGIKGVYVFKQDRLLETQDFLMPPDGYFLLNANINFEFYVQKRARFQIGLRAENIFNTRYRNYLNRMRYFTDEIGQSLIFHINYKF